jgi:thiol-disulfide isomerase/thioredoxin
MTASIIYLSSNDFYILNSEKEGELPKLCNKLRGLSLVYFCSNQCSYCDIFQPIFETLPKEIGGCFFAVINVSDNNQVVKASENTTTPIKYVPYLILYVNNTPFMRYDGVRDSQSIKNFVFEVATKLQSNNNSDDASDKLGGAMSQTVKQMDSHMEKTEEDHVGVPTYKGMYKPVGDDDVCFLTLEDAYGTN